MIKKMISLFVFFMLQSVFAINDIAIPNTFVDSAVIEADDFNENFEEFRDWLNAMVDTLELRYARFTDIKDTNFQKIRTDSIRSNPDIDSISGRPYIDSIITTAIEGNSANFGTITYGGYAINYSQTVPCSLITTGDTAIGTLTQYVTGNKVVSIQTTSIMVEPSSPVAVIYCRTGTLTRPIDCAHYIPFITNNNSDLQTCFVFVQSTSNLITIYPPSGTFSGVCGGVISFVF